MVIIGYRSTLIGQAELNFTTCENCGTKNSYTVYVYGRYFHVFWIPILPIGKTYFAQCSNCEKAYSKEHLFPKEIREAFHTAKVRTPIKRPFWHGLGCMVILGVVLLAIISIVITVASVDGPSDEKRLADKPYKEALDMDIAKLSSNVAPADSLTLYLKDCLSFAINYELNEDEIEYYTEMKTDKMLILMRIRDIKNIKKKSRKKLIEYIEMCLTLSDDPNPKDLYILIEGKYTPILSKTPFEQDLSGYLAFKHHLYPYYEDEVKAIKDSSATVVEPVADSLSLDTIME